MGLSQHQHQHQHQQHQQQQQQQHQQFVSSSGLSAEDLAKLSKMQALSKQQLQSSQRRVQDLATASSSPSSSTSSTSSTSSSAPVPVSSIAPSSVMDPRMAAPSLVGRALERGMDITLGGSGSSQVTQAQPPAAWKQAGPVVTQYYPMQPLQGPPPHAHQHQHHSSQTTPVTQPQSQPQAQRKAIFMDEYVPFPQYQVGRQGGPSMSAYPLPPAGMVNGSSAAKPKGKESRDRVSLQHLLKNALLLVDDVLTCKDDKGTLTKDGGIRSQVLNEVFTTPSAWAIALVKLKNPSSTSSCNGWDMVYKGDLPLDHYRKQYQSEQDALEQALLLTQSSSERRRVLEDKKRATAPFPQYHQPPSRGGVPPEEREDSFSREDKRKVPFADDGSQIDKRHKLAHGDESPGSGTDSETPLSQRLPSKPQTKKGVPDSLPRMGTSSPLPLDTTPRSSTPASPAKKSGHTGTAKKPLPSSKPVTAKKLPVEDLDDLEGDLYDHEPDHITRLNVYLPKGFAVDKDICSLCASFGMEHTKDGLPPFVLGFFLLFTVNFLLISPGSVGRLDKMIHCSACGEAFHSTCWNPVKDWLPIESLRRGWRCTFCLVCERCEKSEPEDSLLVCDRCERGYHTGCLAPPLKTIPKGVWLCEGCVQCHNCHLKYPAHNAEWSGDYTLCGDCVVLQEQNQQCPVCGLLYQEDDEDMVMCEGCEAWVHYGCEPTLDPEKMELDTTVTPSRLLSICFLCLTFPPFLRRNISVLPA